MRLFWKSLLILTTVFFASMPMWADTYHLKDGRIQVGILISEDDLYYYLDVYGVPYNQLKSEVEYIEKTGSPGYIPTPTPAGGVFNATPTATPTPDWGIPAPGMMHDITSEVVVAKPTPTPQLVSTVALPGTDLPLLPVVVQRGKIYKVIGNQKLYQAPNVASPIVGSLFNGHTLNGIEEAQGFVHAKTVDGKEGWIHSSLVMPVQGTPCLVVGEGPVSVYESQSEISRSLGVLKRGEVVTQLDQLNDWQLILYQGGVSGWCRKDNLKPLTDESIYKPPMKLLSNDAVGSPILLERGGLGAIGQQMVTITLRDGRLAITGLCKVMVLHRDPNQFNNPALTFSSEMIMNRSRLSSMAEMLNVGLPQELVAQYVGVDVLTMAGLEVDNSLKLTLEMPEDAMVDFAFAVQQGPDRGTVILVR